MAIPEIPHPHDAHSEGERPLSLCVSQPLLLEELFSPGEITPTAYLSKAQIRIVQIQWSNITEYITLFQERLTGRRFSQVLLDATPNDTAFGGHDVSDKHDWPDLYTNARFHKLFVTHTGGNSTTEMDIEPHLRDDMTEEQKDNERKLAGIRTFFHYYEQQKRILDSDFDFSAGAFKSTENTNDYIIAVARWTVDKEGNRSWVLAPEKKTDMTMRALAQAASPLFSSTKLTPEQFDLATGVYAIASLQRTIIDQWPKREGLFGGQRTQIAGSTQAPGLLLGRRDVFLPLCRVFEQAVHVYPPAPAIRFTYTEAPLLQLPADLPIAGTTNGLFINTTEQLKFFEKIDFTFKQESKEKILYLPESIDPDTGINDIITDETNQKSGKILYTFEKNFIKKSKGDILPPDENE